MGITLPLTIGYTERIKVNQYVRSYPMEVYPAPQLNIIALKSNNPTYFNLLLSRSEYSQVEIEQALAATDEVNAKLNSFLSTAYDLLVWEDGSEMSHIWGFASDKHQELSSMLSQLSYLQPNMSENSHLNCFPVVKWQKEIASLNKQIAKVQKFINTL